MVGSQKGYAELLADWLAYMELVMNEGASGRAKVLAVAISHIVNELKSSFIVID